MEFVQEASVLLFPSTYLEKVVGFITIPLEPTHSGACSQAGTPHVYCLPHCQHPVLTKKR